MLIFIYHAIARDANNITCRDSVKAVLTHQASLIIGGQPENYVDEKPEELLRTLFIETIKDRPSVIINEFSQYIASDVNAEGESLLNVKPPSHSLELNLILVFVYMAGRSYGILEKDILQAAQTDQIGYLTLYRNYPKLAKANYLLRPINVPFKNKWLRDTASTLHL